MNNQPVVANSASGARISLMADMNLFGVRISKCKIWPHANFLLLMPAAGLSPNQQDDAGGVLSLQQSVPLAAHVDGKIVRQGREDR